MAQDRCEHARRRDGELVDDDFERWYRASFPRVVRTLSAMFGDVETGRDLAAEAYSRALEYWKRNGAPRSPDSWVLTVGVNLGRRNWRRRRVESQLLGRLRRQFPVLVETPDPELWRAVAALPARAREAVVLRYVADLTEREIADVMDLREGTVAATLHKARARLRELLGERDGP